LAIVGGIAVGCVFGFAISRLLGAISQPVVGNAVLLITPFAVYGCTEAVEGSGLLAVVLAGVWVAHTTNTGNSFEIRLQASAVWSVLTFVLESTAFVFVGVELYATARDVQSPGYLAVAGLVVAIALVIVLTRVAFMGVWFLLTRASRSGREIGWRDASRQYAAVAVLGVRGPVSVLAAFSLPLGLPGRSLIVTLTFGVVILSLVMSLLSPTLIKALRVGASEDRDAFVQARRQVAVAALARLDELVARSDAEGDPLPESMVFRLRTQAVRRVDALAGSTTTMRLAVSQSVIQRRIQRAMIHAERSTLATLRDEEGLPGEVVSTMLHELDVRESALGARRR